MPPCKKDCALENKICNETSGRCIKSKTKQSVKQNNTKPGDIKGAIIELLSIKDVIKCTSSRCAFWIIFDFQTEKEDVSFHIRKFGKTRKIETYAIAIASSDIITKNIIINKYIIDEPTLEKFIEKINEPVIDEVLSSFKKAWNKVDSSKKTFKIDIYPKVTSVEQKVSEAGYKILQAVEY